jgi:hypothetical protein
LIFFLPHFNSLAQNVQIENKIRDLDEKQSVWMLKEDTDNLKKIYDNDLIVNAPFNAVTTGSGVVFLLVHTGFIKPSVFNIKIEKVLIKNGVAVTMGSETITFDKNSTNPRSGQTIKRRYTHVYLNEGGSWKLIARHANEICS